MENLISLIDYLVGGFKLGILQVNYENVLTIKLALFFLQRWSDVEKRPCWSCGCERGLSLSSKRNSVIAF